MAKKAPKKSKSKPKSNKNKPVKKAPKPKGPKKPKPLPVVVKRIDELTPDPENVRVHDDTNKAAIAKSLDEFKQQKPVVIDKKGVIYAGNGTVEQLKAQGVEYVQCVVSDLPPKKLRAYAIADNKTSDLSYFNDPELVEQLKLIRDEDHDLFEATGFDDDMLDNMIDGLTDPEHADEEDDEVPGLPSKVKTKKGFMWELGNHRLLCGSSTDSVAVATLLEGHEPQMMFTDPPYGVNYQGGINFNKANKTGVKQPHTDGNPKKKITGDETAEIYDKFLEVCLPFIDGPCYVWFSDSVAPDIYAALEKHECSLHALIIWNKTNAKYGALNKQYKQRHEPCVYFKPPGTKLRWCGASDENTVWDIKTDGKNEYAPTQKPVELALRAIQNHKADVIVDFFGGSGSTLIACEKIDRTCLTMELDPKQCDIIVARWENYTGEKATLVKEP